MCRWRQSWQVRVQPQLLFIPLFLNAPRHFERKVVCRFYWRQSISVSLFLMCVQSLSFLWLCQKQQWFFVLSFSITLFNWYVWFLLFSIDSFTRLPSFDWIDFSSTFNTQNTVSDSKEWTFSCGCNVFSDCSIEYGSNWLYDANTWESAKSSLYWYWVTASYQIDCR